MSFIKDINQDEFLDEVVEISKTTPVLVDFWAPWCEPCKQLTPTLEKLVNNRNGKVALVKINVDENKDLAAKLNIQSIPTVYAFVDGKPINAFQGAQPEAKIEELINQMIDAAPGNEVPKLLIEAENFFKEEKYEEAKNIYEQLLGIDASNIKVIVGLLRCYYQLKLNDQAQEILESLEEALLKDEEIQKIKKLIDLSINQKVNDGEADDLIEKLDINPKNKEVRFELAIILLRQQKIDEGFENLLMLYEQDSKWNEEAAKKKLLEYFETLGSLNPSVVLARKKLSSMMFK
jgi:putative thioredoxin